MKEFFTVPYVDDSSDSQSRLQKSVLRTETPLHIQPFASAAAVMTYLHRRSPFENQQIYPLPAFLLCSADLKPGNSLDVIARIRAVSVYGALPIIVLGKSEGKASVWKCYAAGADHFLHKPRASARLDVLVQTLYSCAALAPANFEGLSQVLEHHRYPQACLAL